VHISFSFKENLGRWAASERNKLGVGFSAYPLDGFSVQTVESAGERIMEATRACCQALLPFCAHGCNIFRYINAAAMTCLLIQQESIDAFPSSLSNTAWMAWNSTPFHGPDSRVQTTNKTR
jgi:hypothetical protein